MEVVKFLFNLNVKYIFFNQCFYAFNDEDFSFPGNRMIALTNNEFKTPKTKDSNCNLKKSISFNQGQKRRPTSQSELSDCGYGTQVENQESISTSSNDDDSPQVKPIHHPPCNQKQRYNAANKQRNNCLTIQDNKDWRKKKLVKRSRSTL